MKNVSPKSVIIGSFVLAIILIAGAWYFFYKPDSEEAEKIAKDNKQLEQRVSELNAKLSNRQMYQEGIDSAQEIIDLILAKYGPGNTVEKSILRVIDLCEKTGGKITSVSFYENSPYYTSTEKDENGKPKIVMYKTGMAFSVTTGYTSLKQVFNYVNSCEERMNIENFSTSYNPVDGTMNTSMVINMYSVVDDKHEYVAPVIEDIPIGSNNIFKTFERIPEEPVEGEEGVEGAVTQ